MNAPPTKRVAVITGGARGIGFAAARMLAAQGDRIVLADLNGELAQASAARLVAATGVEAVGLQADISVPLDVACLAEAVHTQFGRIDVLVNRLPIGIRQYLHAFALVLLTALALFLAWCAWLLVGESVLFNAKDTSALAIPLVVPQGLWAIGVTMLAVFAVVLLLEIVCLLIAGDAAEIDKLLGPRGYQEETQEALEAVGLAPSRRKDAKP